MIVVDVNVIVYLLIHGERTSLAQALWELDPDWRVPSLWRHEFLNVLATLAKTGALEATAALSLWDEALDLMAEGESEIEMAQALSLAIQRGVSAYDAQYAALAGRLGVPLVTEDQRLRKALPHETMSMQELCSVS